MSRRQAIRNYRNNSIAWLNSPSWRAGRIRSTRWSGLSAISANRFLRQTEHLHPDWTLAHGYALQPDLLAMSQVWQARSGTGFVISAKGAPEAVADLCHLPGDELERIRQDVAALAAEGLRVLAVAEGKFDGRPGRQSSMILSFGFVGLLGLADPLRPEVPEAVAACAGAGSAWS